MKKLWIACLLVTGLTLALTTWAHAEDLTVAQAWKDRTGTWKQTAMICRGTGADAMLLNYSWERLFASNKMQNLIQLRKSDGTFLHTFNREESPCLVMAPFTYSITTRSLRMSPVAQYSVPNSCLDDTATRNLDDVNYDYFVRETYLELVDRNLHTETCPMGVDLWFELLQPRKVRN